MIQWAKAIELYQESMTSLIHRTGEEHKPRDKRKQRQPYSESLGPHILTDLDTSQGIHAEQGVLVKAIEARVEIRQPQARYDYRHLG